MKVLLINGSPHKNCYTFTALSEISKTLEDCGVGSEIFHIGLAPISGCRACGACSKIGKCAVKDSVNEFLDMAEYFDGFVFGSPVHYAAASGALTSFMDRAFFVNFAAGRKIFEHKPAAAVASARRSGTTATLDQLNKYFTITQMPVVSGRYWNMVHGHTPEEVRQDLEGMQNMRFLARNMAWLLKSIEAGKKAGVEMPRGEEAVYTNFIR